MNILMVNQSWLRHELEAAGHRIFSVAMTNDGCDLEFRRGGISVEELLAALPADFVPERIIYWDDSTVSWICGLEELDIPKLFYSVDAHHHYTWHPQFSAVFDQVLVALKDEVHKFHEFSPEAAWLPIWVQHDALPDVERDLDTVFVGTFDDRIHPKRREFFEAVRRLTKVSIFSGDYRQPYARAKIVLNQVVSGDLNFRVFEALNSGSLLITPKIGNGLLDLFGDGEDLVCYEDGNPEDAAEKVLYYLRNDSLRREIAARGAREVRALHTKQARAESIHAMLGELTRVPKKNRAFGAAFGYLVAYLVCKHQNLVWGPKMLEPAIDAFLRCRNLTAGEQVQTAVLISTFIAEERGAAQALDFLERALERSEGCRILELAVIQKLQQLDRHVDAVERAGKISTDAEGLCQSVDELLRVALGEGESVLA